MTLCGQNIEVPVFNARGLDLPCFKISNRSRHRVGVAQTEGVDRPSRVTCWTLNCRRNRQSVKSFGRMGPSRRISPSWMDLRASFNDPASSPRRP
jgi:hypothetical protein